MRLATGRVKKQGFAIGGVMKNITFCLRTCRRISAVLALGAILAGLGTANAGAIPDADLLRIQNELFPKPREFTVRQKNWKGVAYYFISGRLASKTGDNQALVRTRLDQESRKALVKRLLRSLSLIRAHVRRFSHSG